MTRPKSAQSEQRLAAEKTHDEFAALPTAGLWPELTPAGEQAAAKAAAPEPAVVSVLGVRVANATLDEAAATIASLIDARLPSCQAIYFVNAHTLNLATAAPDYRRLLNRAYRVYGDGTGVRWAARGLGVRMRDNVNGTDLMPHLFCSTAERGYRYFLLGADPESICRAAATAREWFAGWRQVGFHHGYLRPEEMPRIVTTINAAAPDLLLVGMGNPLQERWIDEHLDRLEIPVAIGVGGLFDHWAGNLRRAPRWIRRLGCEWCQLLWQQPHKWRRYLLGNPAFLLRMWALRDADRRRTRRWGNELPPTEPD
jgi:N-acetylglucosaminyldiphosphoundecaprenol N-acetyl-beta-D-mannosaminyltransferase